MLSSLTGSRRAVAALPTALPTAILTLALFFAPSRAGAAILASFDLSSGENTSSIQIDFSNGDGYLFYLHYTAPISGFAALQAIDSQIASFALDYDNTQFGPLVTGLGVLADYEYGNGDQWPVVENYWHYYVKDSGAWDWSPVGAADRMLFNGSSDGWVFGTPVLPQPVPAPAAFVLLAITWSMPSRSRR